MSVEDCSYRSFGGIDPDDDEIALNPIVQRGKNDNTKNKLMVLRDNIIGMYDEFQTPYGTKPIVYSDWTASGRGLHSIEKYIQDNVLRFYGNTHTTSSISGHQSTCFRHESRQIVAESTNAKITGKASQDVVLFIGNGTTAAVNKIIASLGLTIALPEGLDENIYRPVVFVSSYEHHSNLLPWRESIADVVSISYNPITGVDVVDLRLKLEEYGSRKLKIGAFSAASNVTGILTDVDSISILMHKHGGIVFFDYATAAPYVKMDMNPVISGPDSEFVYKDGIFFSGHKFIGGPGSPGVLIIKKALLPSSDIHPTLPGGGTVFYVTGEHHRYLSNREEREEGGTPCIIGDIRLGLIMHMKSTIGISFIENEEYRLASYVKDKLIADERIMLLGRDETGGKQLPIFSFMIRYRDRFLHYNYICALLNDLFGIQSRGGCQCAGPFSHALLGITAENSHKIELALLDKHEVFRPGFTRLSFPYWSTAEEVDYIVNAILFIAEHGWMFLPSYRYNHKTGEWAHTTRLTRFPERLWISNANLLSTSSSTSSTSMMVNTYDKANLAEMFMKVMDTAMEEVSAIEKLFTKKKTVFNSTSLSSNDDISGLEEIKWFILPEEISYHQDMLHDIIGPIQPSCSIISSSTNNIDMQSSIDMTIDSRYDGQSDASSYAQKRHLKLRARVGGEDVQKPRYLVLGNNNISSSSVANQSIPPPMMSTIQPTHHIHAQSAVHEEKIESTIDDDTSPSLPTCTDGSCLMPRKSSIITSHDHNITVSNTTGKILQGPGYTYMGLSPPIIIPCLIPKKIMKLVGQAVKDWKMIEEGDRLLLGLSGGKDSLCLLHVLLALQKRAPVRFEIACATVDPQTESYDPTPLIPYIQSLGVTYHYLSEPIVEMAKSKLQGDSLCAFCSRFKRGLLYSCCRSYQYNKLVLGQHLDDLAESFMMSALHNGQIRTMKANYAINAGDVRVIRPLVYVREKQTRDFSLSSKLPIINENCPACFEQPKERARMKKLLLQEESMVQNLYFNLKRGLQPLMHERTYEVMTEIANEIEANNKIFIHRSKVEDVSNSSSSMKDEVVVNESMMVVGDDEGDGREEAVAKRPRYVDDESF